MFDQAQAEGHEDGAPAHLEQRQRAEIETRRDVGQGEAVESEAHGAAEGEDVADVDGGEIGQQRRAGAGGRGEEEDAEEGKRGAQEGVPARRAGAGRAQHAGQGRAHGGGKRIDNKDCGDGLLYVVAEGLPYGADDLAFLGKVRDVGKRQAHETGFEE